MLIGVFASATLRRPRPDGVFPFVRVSAEGKNARAALLSTVAAPAPDPPFQPPDRNRRVGSVPTCSRHTGSARDPPRPTPTFRPFIRDMMNYDWTINGRPFADPNHHNAAPPQCQQKPTKLKTFHPKCPSCGIAMHLHAILSVIRPDCARRPQYHCRGASHAQTGVALVADNPGGLDAALPQHLPQ